MSDIKQAVEWMAQGKRVRRNAASWGPGDSIAPEHAANLWSPIMYQIPSRPVDEKYIASLDDLLADDWEIAE